MHTHNIHNTNSLNSHPLGLGEIQKKIKNNEFDWQNFGWYVAQYLPDHFDPSRYNWDKHSWHIAKYCPEKMVSEHYNWMEHSWAVARYCPGYIDVTRYNWEQYSWDVIEYCPAETVLTHISKLNFSDKRTRDAIRNNHPHILLKSLMF